jgi:hypothetical protein
LDSGRRLGSVSYNLHGRLQSGWVQQPHSGRAPVAILTPMGSFKSDNGRSALQPGTALHAPNATFKTAPRGKPLRRKTDDQVP